MVTDYKRLTVKIEDAAKILGISRALAYELANRGELPGVLRLGHRFVVSLSALENALLGESKCQNREIDSITKL